MFCISHRNLLGKARYSAILALLSLPLHGQLSLIQDTVKITEVIITSKRTTADIIGFKNYTIDSSVISNYRHESLSDLLIQNSAVFIKSYGMGGSATPSFRGTGASHTQLQWNNININNPMLGQPDLSLVPAGLVDEIDIYYGGSSMPSGIGGIGGMINLETKAVWRKETLISLNPGLGSFGQYTGLVKVRTGNLNFQSVTKAYFQHAENNFSYVNDVRYSYPVNEVMDNAQSQQKGFMQELYYRKTRNVLSARLWYQSADRNLPSSMLIQQPDNNEKQTDESLRTMINYEGFSGLIDYFVTGSVAVSKLDYSNNLASIDSRNKSESFVIKGGITNRITEAVHIKLILDNEHTLVNSENYNDNKAARNVASLTAIAEINSSGRVGATFLLREILNGNSFLIPDFSTGLQIKIANDRDYFLKANYSRNSKLPSMNDLYWAPGGNTDLVNETANMFEVMYEMNHRISSPVLLKFDISLYHNSIDEMIQWRPGNYSYWVADNVKSVGISGLESSASVNYSLNKISSSLSLNYNYTNSSTTGSEIQNDESIGKQLIYVPENQGNATLRFSYYNLYASWISEFTGRRYTTVDNTSYLQGYVLNSVTSGYVIHHSANVYSLNLKVDNLFNSSYETIAYYPQPGRNYSLNLLIQFAKQ
jgi:vitamin B12 transporter